MNKEWMIERREQSEQSTLGAAPARAQVVLPWLAGVDDGTVGRNKIPLTPELFAQTRMKGTQSNAETGSGVVEMKWQKLVAEHAPQTGTKYFVVINRRFRSNEVTLKKGQLFVAMLGVPPPHAPAYGLLTTGVDGKPVGVGIPLLPGMKIYVIMRELPGQQATVLWPATARASSQQSGGPTAAYVHGVDDSRDTHMEEMLQKLSGVSLRAPQQLAGVPSTLGAPPPVVKKWFPERNNSEWDDLDPAYQNDILMKAQAVDAQWNASIYQYKAEGACDATQPGRLAGALRAYLIASGGNEDSMGDADDTFGPLECKEWMKLFNKQPDLAAAKESLKAGFGTVQTGTPTYGWRKIYLTDVCPSSSIKLPTCAPIVQQQKPPPPVEKPECDASTPCPPGQACVDGKCVTKPSSGTAKKSNMGLFVLAAAGVGLAFIATRSQMSDAYKGK